MPESAARRLPELHELVGSLEGRMDALVICLSHSWGGLEQVAANDALDIGALGLKVRVLCLEGSPIQERLALMNSVQTLPLSFRPRNYFDLKMRNELRRILADGVNLIHTHQTSILGSIVPWLWGNPAVAMLATRHIMSNHNKRDFFHRAIYSRLDALLVISDALRLNVLETHPVIDRKIKVVNLGLDFDRFDPAKVDPEGQRQRWGADRETLLVGLVGRIDPAKGQATLIRAAAGLLKNLPPSQKIRFVIVGEETKGAPGAFLDELKKMVKQFRLDEHILFAGFAENVPEVMRAFDIFVMPSRKEAFGLVAIEAMAMECPIIISQGGSSLEIAGENQEYGLLVRPDDAFDLHQQLRFMVEHPELRKEMGKRGRQHVRRNYDRQNRIRRTLQIYERAMLRRRLL